MKLWRAAKWAALIVLALVLTIVLARLFSGPEDAWVRDEAGRWVAHGHPGGPPPAPDYREPVTRQVVPWLIVGIVVSGLAAGVLLSRRAPATREGLHSNLRLFRAVNIVSAALAAALAVALVITFASEWGEAFDEPLVAVLALLGLLGFLSLFAMHAHGTKKVLEAHYDLKRTAALLQDAVERLTDSLAKPSAR